MISVYPDVQYVVVPVSNGGIIEYEIHYITPLLRQKISTIFRSDKEARDFIRSLENLGLSIRRSIRSIRRSK